MQARPDFQPLYKQVYAVLVRRIADSEWQPGDSLPSEQVLALELGVSQGTVRKALDALAAEKLVQRRQGKGTFVAEHTQEHALFRFFRIARPHPDGERVIPESGSDRVRRRTATAIERSKLSLRKGALIVEIKRTRLIDHVPAITEKIVLPLELFPEIDHQNSLPNTLYSLYQSVYGISVATAHEELSAVSATKEDAKRLTVEPGSPLLQIARVAIGIDKQKVEWRLSRCDTRNLVYVADVY